MPEPIDAPEVADHLATEPAELDGVAEDIVGFIEDQDRRAGADGVVVVVGGEINSAVATMLAVEALGRDRVFGLLLSSYKHSESDTFAAELFVEGLGIDYETVQILPFVHLFQELSVPDLPPPESVRATTNAVDRIRTACVYYAANVMNRLVLGTENRTEWLLGTVTKYGARRGDLLPLGACYRTEVENLASRLGIPEGILAPDAGGRDGVDRSLTDVSPTTLDAVLVKLVDEDKEIDQTALELGLDPEAVRQYAELHVGSRHKREQPPTPKTGRDDRYDRFHEIELQFY